MAAPGDFSTIVGRQRAVLPQAPPGGRVVVGGTIQSFDVMIIEAGTAVRENFFLFDDSVTPIKLSIPIIVVPASATVIKTVAGASLGTIHWDGHADSAWWGVEQVDVEEDTTTRQLSLVASLTQGGTETSFTRIAYHITIFMQAPNTPPQELDL
jgi:hypothetical protein